MCLAGRATRPSNNHSLPSNPAATTTMLARQNTTAGLPAADEDTASVKEQLAKLMRLVDQQREKILEETRLVVQQQAKVEEEQLKLARLLAKQTRLEEEAWVQGGPRPSAHTRLVRTREAAVKALPDIHIHLAKIDAITKSLFPQHMRVGCGCTISVTFRSHTTSLVAQCLLS